MTLLARPVEPAPAESKPPHARRELPRAGTVLLVTLLAALAGTALVPALIANQDPLTTSLTDALAAPGPDHWFGTDNLGRDVWSRVVHGARTSLAMALAATVISTVVGTVLGVLAGIWGRTADRILSRGFDVLFAFPDILIALIVIAMLGPGAVNATIAIGIGGVPGFARLVRGEVIRLRSAGFVETATLLGLTRGWIAARHIVPNALGPILTMATLNVGSAIISVSALSFLGFGAPPPTPEWGLMLAEGRLYLAVAPWMCLGPGISITLAVIAFTLTGRRLRRNLVRA
jgi:peptide/nickel transport system permease protein